MRICVLGTHPLTGVGPKVGIQHIAETLAGFGHDVVYVTSHASPLMLFVPEHSARFRRTARPLMVAPRLRQLTPVNLVPARVLKRLETVPGGRILATLDDSFQHTRKGALEREHFDVCICSAASTLTLVDRISSSRLYYRLNDLMSGFHGVPRSLLGREAALLRSARLDGVWAVNAQLASFATTTAPGATVAVQPNGVALRLFEEAEPDAALVGTRERNVIYVGAVEFWVDVALLFDSARLLPTHAFHIYGPWAIPVPKDMPENVHVHGPIAHDAIASKMKACAVGIIPAGPGNRGRMVERPLKYYEYLAAGLGVAATSLAGDGLEPFAVIGDTPRAFADAILRARDVPRLQGRAIAAAVGERDWPLLVRRMLPDS